MIKNTKISLKRRIEGSKYTSIGKWKKQDNYRYHTVRCKDSKGRFVYEYVLDQFRRDRWFQKEKWHHIGIISAFNLERLKDKSSRWPFFIIPDPPKRKPKTIPKPNPPIK